jgi:hypothetical protein
MAKDMAPAERLARAAQLTEDAERLLAQPVSDHRATGLLLRASVQAQLAQAHVALAEAAKQGAL